MRHEFYFDNRKLIEIMFGDKDREIDFEDRWCRLMGKLDMVQIERSELPYILGIPETVQVAGMDEDVFQRAVDRVGLPYTYVRSLI